MASPSAPPDVRSLDEVRELRERARDAVDDCPDGRAHGLAVDRVVTDAFLAGVAYGRENPEHGHDGPAHVILLAIHRRLRRYFASLPEDEPTKE